MPALFVINTSLGRGSTGRIAETVATLAQKEGWSCYAAHGRRYVAASKMASFPVSGKVEEIEHYVLSRIFDRHGLGATCATEKLIARIQAIHPDVVHLHNVHGYFLNFEVLFRFLAEKGYPTVITMHDFWLMTGHCAYINKSCDRWKTGCGNCPRLKEYPAAFLDRSKKNWKLKKELFANFDKNKLVIVPVSYWLERFAKQSLLGNGQFHVIQNGVDTQVFQPYEGEHSDLWRKIDWSRLTIITVADRWTEANGFYDIIALSRMLPEDMQIVMVGLDKLQIQDLPENIIGIEHTDNVRQLVELYSSADVLLNVSTEVTFGLVTAEALACGTPAIVFKNTAGEEIIAEGTGYSINRIEEIPALVRVCREKAEKFILSCRKRIVENFDSVQQYSKYITLYNDLLMR